MPFKNSDGLQLVFKKQITVTGSSTVGSSSSYGYASSGTFGGVHVIGGGSSRSSTHYSTRRTNYFTITFQIDTEMKNYQQLQDLYLKFESNYYEAQSLWDEYFELNAAIKRRLKIAALIFLKIFILFPLAIIIGFINLCIGKHPSKKAKRLLPTIYEKEEIYKKTLEEAKQIEK